MKNTMKRGMAMLLALIMVMSLAACGEKTKSTEAQTDKQTEAPADKQTEAPADQTQGETEPAAPAEYELGNWVFAKDPASISGTVRFYIPFKGSQGMDDMIAEFNETYPNITIDLHPYNNNSDGNLAVNTSIMAHEVDVLASFGLSATYNRWANGLFLSLEDYIKEYGIDVVKEWGTDVYKYDDTYYTFPCGGLGYYVAINMTDWNNAGLGELPTEWTWDEYLEASKKMTQKDANGNVLVYGGSDYHSVNYYTYVWYQVYGHDQYYLDDLSGVSFSDPMMINALKREIKAETEDKIWFPLTTYRDDNIQAQQTFLKHQVASVIIPNLPRFLRDKETWPVDWITGFAPWPVEEKGQTNYMSGISTFSHAGICDGVQDKEAAWCWLAWYSTYGVKYLSIAGHAPAWKGTNPGDLVTLIFGSEEEAATLVDLESFRRVVGNFDGPSYIDTCLDAYSDVSSLVNEYTMYAHRGTMTVDDAMKELTEKANDAIAKAREK